MAFKKTFKKFTPRTETVRGTSWNPATLPPATSEVTAILDAVRANQSVTVEAVAGSGKTTLVSQVLANTEVRNLGNVTYFAFNNSVKNEALEKLPADVAVSTFHAQGMQLLRGTGKRYNVNKDKLEELMGTFGDRLENLSGELIVKLAYLARINLAGSLEDCENVAKEYNILCTPSELAIVWELIGLCDLSTRTGVIDFADMLRAPWLLNVSNRSIHFAFIDESQDLSRGAIEVIKRSTAPTCQFLIVGDKMQGIYSFAGASSESMDALTSYANSQVFPLSVSWRCGTAIVEHSNEVEGYARTVARPNAPAGTVETCEPVELLQNFPNDALVIARTRASLITLAFRLYRDGTEFQYIGDSPFKQICGKFYSYVKGTENAIQFRAGLESWLEDNDAIDDSSPLDSDTDIIACCKIFAQMVLLDSSITNSRELYTLAETLGTGKVGPRITTIHRAKGLEADTVVILDPHTMPHPRAITALELEQESHLQYVARTRAKLRIIYCTVGESQE